MAHRTGIAIGLALACGAALAQSDQEILGYTPKKPPQRTAPVISPDKMAPLKAPYSGVARYPAPREAVSTAPRQEPPRCVYKPVMTDEEIRNCSRS